MPSKTIIPDFDGRAFLDIEGDGDGGGRNLFDFRFDDGKLVAMLAQQLAQNDFRVLDAGGVILALNGDAGFFLLESLGDIGERDRIETLVVDLADGRLFLDVDDELEAGRGGDFFNANGPESSRCSRGS